MSVFFFVIFIATTWMALTGDISVYTFVVGVLIGFAVWRIFGFKARRPFSIAGASRLLWLGTSLLLIFLVDLVRANLHQLRIVLAPRIAISPCWLQFRTSLETPAMRAVLGSMIVMTPGTVAYGETQAEDGAWIIGVHALHVEGEADLSEVIDQIRRRFESRLKQMEML
jgi:multisubunit Na+/H+ antiporter MnhE subunit